MIVEFNVPKELEEEMKYMTNEDMGSFISRIVEERLQKLAKLKQIVSKS